MGTCSCCVCTAQPFQLSLPFATAAENLDEAKGRRSVLLIVPSTLDALVVPVRCADCTPRACPFFLGPAGGVLFCGELVGANGCVFPLHALSRNVQAIQHGTQMQTNTIDCARYGVALGYLLVGFNRVSVAEQSIVAYL